MKIPSIVHSYQSVSPAGVGVVKTPTPSQSRQVGAPEKAAEVAMSGKAGVAEVEQAVRKINDYLQVVQRNLQFSVDRDTHRVVVKVVDANTGEVVRQIPPESVLEMARNMKARDKEPGILFAQLA